MAADKFMRDYGYGAPPPGGRVALPFGALLKPPIPSMMRRSRSLDARDARDDDDIIV